MDPRKVRLLSLQIFDAVIRGVIASRKAMPASMSGFNSLAALRVYIAGANSARSSSDMISRKILPDKNKRLRLANGKDAHINFGYKDYTHLGHP